MKIEHAYQNASKIIMGQDDILKKLILAFNNNNRKGNLFHQNILLLGRYGLGKTTLVKQATKILDLPFCEVNGAFSLNAVDMSPFDSVMNQLYEKTESLDLYGVVLIHGMDKCFQYGQVDSLEQVILQQNIYGSDGNVANTSKITFVGEVDTNDFDQKYINDNKKPIGFGSRHTNTDEEEISQAVYEVINNYNTHRMFNTQLKMNKLTDKKVEEMLKNEISPLKALEGNYGLIKNSTLIKSDEFIKEVANKVVTSKNGMHDIYAIAQQLAYEKIGNFNDKKARLGKAKTLTLFK